MLPFFAWKIFSISFFISLDFYLQVLLRFRICSVSLLRLKNSPIVLFSDCLKVLSKAQGLRRRRAPNRYYLWRPLHVCQERR